MSERMTDERLADYEFDDDGCQLLAYFKAERSRVAELEAKLKDRHRRLTAMQSRNADLLQAVDEMDYTKAIKQRAEAAESTINKMLCVYRAAVSGKSLVSNQGQSLDGFSELANYRAILAMTDKSTKGAKH
jgi:hypothetical protein